MPFLTVAAAPAPSTPLGPFGSVAGLFAGLEVTLSLAGTVLLAVLAFWPALAGRARAWLLGGGLAAGAVALGTTKFPTDASEGWGRTLFETGVWMLHLLGGAIWLGGLAGLLLLGIANQFWPHPRIEALRAAGDQALASPAGREPDDLVGA